MSKVILITGAFWLFLSKPKWLFWQYDYFSKNIHYINKTEIVQFLTMKSAKDNFTVLYHRSKWVFEELKIMCSAKGYKAVYLWLHSKQGDPEFSLQGHLKLHIKIENPVCYTKLLAKRLSNFLPFALWPSPRKRSDRFLPELKSIICITQRWKVTFHTLIRKQ